MSVTTKKLIENTKRTKAAKVTGLVIWIFLTIGCSYLASVGWSNFIPNDDSTEIIIRVGFIFFPFLFLGATYGYLLAMFSFLLSFFTSLYFDMQNSYCMSILMVAAIIFSMFSQYFYFSNLKKTFIAVIITDLLISVTEVLCINILKENVDFSFEALTAYYGYNFIAVLGCGLVIYLLFTKTSDNFKSIFDLGVGYTKKYTESTVAKRSLRKTKVSIKITFIIILVELLLGISVAVFTVVLFPDITNMITGSIQNDSQFVPILDVTKKELINQINSIDYTYTYQTLYFDIKMILLMLCVGVPMAAMFNFYAKINIGAPIGVMSDFMNDFAHAKDCDKSCYTEKVDEIEINNVDEIGVMFEAIRSTVYEMDAYVERLKEEQKLESELEIARQSNEAKSAFLSNMSHEIRTPINAVLGMNEMILRESNEEQILEYSNNIKSAGNSLLSLVNDILDFSKIEAGKLEILPVQYNLGSLINDLINMISTKAQEKGLELDVSVDEHIPAELIGDEVRIKQCVTNILTNAVKYTETGKITMAVTYSVINDIEISLGFQVVDTGIGIKEEDLEKLFSPFERIEEIRNRTIEGTGLGMSIVKKLLALMNTKLIVKSEYGKGSDFSFEIKQQVFSWDEIGDFKKKYKDYIHTSKKYYQKLQAPDARILVVDDTEMNLVVMKSLLKQTQIKIDTAMSGYETLDMVRENVYDMIFLDHRMPNMDGIETFEAMKTLEGNLNCYVPIIALTANAVSGAKEEYIAHGFTDYLSKPVNGVLLEEMLIHYLPPEHVKSVSIYNGKDSYVSSLCDSVPKDSFLNDISDINLEEGLKNCGGAESMEKVVKNFYNDIEIKAQAIEDYLRENDLRNYTVLVHALKSSARLIGAEMLSEMAADLEDRGNKNDIESIKEKTPILLEKYRSLRKSLSACQKKEAQLPLIEENKLLEAFNNINELAQVYDYETIEDIIGMLDDYSIPETFAPKYESLKKCVMAVDREGIIQLTSMK